MVMMTSTLLFFTHITTGLACVPTLQPTTPTPICCPPITTNNPPRRTPIPTSSGASLDQCSVFRRFTRGTCPSEAILVCSRAPGTTVSQVVLELSDGTNIVAMNTDPIRAILVVSTITCMSDGTWQYVNAAGTAFSFNEAYCSQGTLTSGDYSYDV
uniref:C6 domain-containing protein n=1 Tax=Syphacia muris TaxID=451379 RepID=A0A0N5AZY7_9BILA